MKKDIDLISTIKERCRVCYTCVRDCPAKAIRISGGQAEVIPQRCIGCGNCVLVCSQNAKQVAGSIDRVRDLLTSGKRLAAIIAPSFPADFPEGTAGQFVAAIRSLGFDIVSEVAFGADLVARAYRRWVENHPDEQRISTSCPAVVNYVEKYHPELVKHLAPFCSPMVAMGRVLRRMHGDGLKIVFIGPCFAKKTEPQRESQRGDIDEVLSFRELRTMLEAAGIALCSAGEDDFDPPHPGLGMLFPISRGSIQAGGMIYDLLKCDVIAAEGKEKFTHALREFENGTLKTRLLEALCCNGCIMGPGMSRDLPYFRRRSYISKYARQRAEQLDREELERNFRDFGQIDLSDSFIVKDMRLPLPSGDDLQSILSRMGKLRPEDELDCGACGYETCREHALAIHKGLAESEMCLPFTIDRLKQSLNDLHRSNAQLADTQQALINAEKLASMGQLSAGIAHEINNPLGVILLYSKLMLEEAEEGSERQDELLMIVEQAERCKGIVAGLLNFARKSRVDRCRTNLISLIERCLKSLIIPAGVDIDVRHHLADPQAEVDAGQIMQVLTNLLRNAVEAMTGKGKIVVSSEERGGEIRITVADNGSGIPQHIMKKIFEPLFTTKQVGKGTGLGLAVSYGIVKMHKGRIEVQSNADPACGPTGSRFTVILPRRAEAAGATL